VLTVAMLAACMFCARDLWARGTLGAWALVALMNLAMIVIHTLRQPRITTAAASTRLRRCTIRRS
jgi:hypothetical protein